MLKFVFNRWICWTLFIAALVALGVGIHDAQPPPLPMCEIDAVEYRPLFFVDGGRMLVTVPATNLAMRPQGFATSFVGEVRVWDPNTGSEMARYFRPDQEVLAAASSKNRKFFAAETETLVERNRKELLVRTLHFIDLIAGESREVHLEDNQPGFIQFSPNGEVLMRLIDRTEGRELQIYETGKGRLLYKRQGKLAMLWAGCSDEAILYAVNEDPQHPVLEVWSVPERKVVATLNEFADDPILGSPDGRFLLLRRLAPVDTWVVWDIRSNRLQAEFQAPIVDLHIAVISADNRFLAVTCFGEQGPYLEVRDLLTGQRAGPVLHEFASRIAISPDGHWLLAEEAFAPEPLYLAEVSSMARRWKRKAILWHQDRFSRDSRSAFAVSQEAPEVICIDAATGAVCARIALFSAMVQQTFRLEMTPDGGSVLVHQKDGPRSRKTWLESLPWVGRHFKYISNDTVVVFDADARRERLRLQGTGATHAELSQDGRILVTRHDTDGRPVLRCWDVNAGRPLYWAVGVPAGLGMPIILFVWWRRRRIVKVG